MTELSLKSALDFAVDAAWQAGRITLKYFQTGVAVDTKQDNTPVTIADRESEQLLRNLITRYYPDHGIIGEEFGTKVPTSDSGYAWIVDPIDGTKSFIHGVPLYGVLVALTHNDKSVVGVAHFPALNETIYAAVDEGCYWNGRRAKVSEISNLADAALMSSSVVIKGDGWPKLVNSTRLQRTWGDAYGYALVATGRAEIMVDGGMAVWDCAPMPVIMEEAGGTFTTWEGVTTIHAPRSIGTNGKLLQATIEILTSGG
jgi:histidinol-phosphatase